MNRIKLADRVDDVLNERGPDGHGTIGDWLSAALGELLRDPEGFSGKRPLSDSGWMREIDEALDRHEVSLRDMCNSLVIVVADDAVPEEPTQAEHTLLEYFAHSLVMVPHRYTEFCQIAFEEVGPSSNMNGAIHMFKRRCENVGKQITRDILGTIAIELTKSDNPFSSYFGQALDRSIVDWCSSGGNHV